MGAALAGLGMMTLQARIARKALEATDIVSLELVPAAGDAFPPFTAGAHIDVDVGNGIVRQYSLCNAPGESHRYIIAVKLEEQSRGGSQAIHERLQAGDVITIGVPRNHFPLATSARHHLLLAGGIGVTPFVSMVAQLARNDDSFALHYFTRTAGHTAFLSQLKSVQTSAKVSIHHGALPHQLRVFLRKLLWRRDPGTHLYVCGPAPFIELALSAAAGWPADTVHREYFSNTVAVPAELNRAFTVQLARSGMCVEVAACQSIVQALQEHGVTIGTSCAQGVCGTCLTGLVDGVAEHRDKYLTEQEKIAGKQIIPCVSRALGDRLTLDL